MVPGVRGCNFTVGCDAWYLIIQMGRLECGAQRCIGHDGNVDEVLMQGNTASSGAHRRLSGNWDQLNYSVHHFRSKRGRR